MAVDKNNKAAKSGSAANFPFEIRISAERRDLRDSMMKALSDMPLGLCPILKRTLPHLVAYHHAGLVIEERRIIEMYFRLGVVGALCTTSTLAAGKLRILLFGYYHAIHTF